MTVQLNQKAFSLLELLVALAILTILISICYPSYQQYVLQSYRAEALTGLLQLANAQEQHRVDFGQYSADFTALGYAHLLDAERYQFSIVLHSTALAYNLSATPLGVQRSDTECPVLTLNQLGQRNAETPQYTHCWR